MFLANGNIQGIYSRVCGQWSTPPHPTGNPPYDFNRAIEQSMWQRISQKCQMGWVVVGWLAAA